ncbi:SMI1/KNR4 family protein [Paenibacillus agricola]|nr:SMI1/KNR4 family protein [Paenibacillus agricola]
MAMDDGLKWKYIKQAINETVIQRVEMQLGVSFPQSYKDCVLLFHGARPEPNEFRTENGEEKAVRSLLPLEPYVKGNVIEVWGWISDRLAPGLVPFADDAFGNYLCFDFRDGASEEPKVLFWDHDKAAMAPDHAVILVASTFSELMNRIAGKEG